MGDYSDRRVGGTWRRPVVSCVALLTIIGAVVGAPRVVSAAPAKQVSSVHLSRSVTRDVAAVITSSNTATFTLGAKGVAGVSAIGTPVPVITELGSLPIGVKFRPGEHKGSALLIGTPGRESNALYKVTLVATNGVSRPFRQVFVLDVVSPPLSAAVLKPVYKVSHFVKPATKKAPAFTSAATTTFKVGTTGFVQHHCKWIACAHDLRVRDPAVCCEVHRYGGYGQGDALGEAEGWERGELRAHPHSF